MAGESDSGRVTSDGGGQRLREMDQRLDLQEERPADRFSASDAVAHRVASLVARRICVQGLVRNKRSASLEH